MSIVCNMNKMSNESKFFFSLWKGFWVVLLGLVFTGCTAFEPAPQGSSLDSRQPKHMIISCSDVIQPEHQVELDAIDGLIESKQYYAGLAKLESLSFDTQAHWLRWAQLLGRVDQLAYSQEIFRVVANECGSYQAYHGLGVVYVKQQMLDQAVEVLSIAKDLAPSDASIRNDYGYALLKIGRFDRAAFELRTAFELSEGNASSRRNMIAAYYLVGGDASVFSLQLEVSLTADQIDRGRAFARTIVEETP